MSKKITIREERNLVNRYYTRVAKCDNVPQASRLAMAIRERRDFDCRPNFKKHWVSLAVFAEKKLNALKKAK